MKHKPFKCSRCGKRFTTPHGTEMHIAEKHDGGTVEKHVPRHERDDYEPSMAETLIDATIAHACGEEVDDYLYDMFPEAFDE